MTQKTDKRKILTVDEEMMMWCAYRYAIGRHTYVNSLAEYIAKNYYGKLTYDRSCFTAEDIRKCINDCLSFGGLSFHYDGSVSYEERDGLTDFINWVNENITEEKDLVGIDTVTVYKESYAKGAPKLYRIQKSFPNVKNYYSALDFNDLICWHNLASLFDIKNHKMLTVEYDGKTEQYECFEGWAQEYEDIPDQPGYCKIVPFRWKKVWRSVNDFIAKGNYSGYLFDKYIKTVEDMPINDNDE